MDGRFHKAIFQSELRAVSQSSPKFADRTKVREPAAQSCYIGTLCACAFKETKIWGHR